MAVTAHNGDIQSDSAVEPLSGLFVFHFTFPGRKVVSSKAALVFRVAAVAEAFSWAGLLIGMYFKYALHSAHEGGVPVLGMVHGVIFDIRISFWWVERVRRRARRPAVPVRSPLRPCGGRT